MSYSYRQRGQLQRVGRIPQTLLNGNTMNFLAYVESRGGKLRGSGLEALATAASLAAETGGSVVALLVGPNAAALAPELGKYGVGKVFVADAPELAGYTPEGYREAVIAGMNQCGAEVVVLAATILGRDLAPVLAAKLKAALLPDCTAIKVEDGKLVVNRPVYAGRCLMTLAAQSFPAVVSVRPKAFPVKPGEALPVETVALTVNLAGVIRARLVEERSEAGGKLDVSEADVIVAGGRGLKGPENFGMIEELADLLHGAVGVSRPVVDSGWRPHGEQVGQTGKVVGPTLYIAAGISGAIQHLAGMRSSKVIVAINKDAEAPIFKAADYGIIGDALEVVPALIKAVRESGR